MILSYQSATKQHMHILLTRSHVIKLKCYVIVARYYVIITIYFLDKSTYRFNELIILLYLKK